MTNVTISRELLASIIEEHAPGYHDCIDLLGYECEWCELRAALAAPVQGEAEPFAVTTGYFGGHATIRPVNPAMVINPGLALYTTPPQPAEVGELVELLKMVRQEGWYHPLEEHEIARIDTALAKLEGK